VAAAAAVAVADETLVAHPKFQQLLSQALGLGVAAMPAPSTDTAASVSAGELQTDKDVVIADLQHAARMAEQSKAVEAEALRMHTREAEHKLQLLTNEVTSLRSAAQAQAMQYQSASANVAGVATYQHQHQSLSPHSPQQAAITEATLLSFETQIGSLEKRLVRREKELQVAIDEGKSASKLERARLESIHREELREKDEQLVKFQGELEQLVYALRQWQLTAQHAQAEAQEAQQQHYGLPAPPTAVQLSM